MRLKNFLRNHYAILDSQIGTGGIVGRLIRCTGSTWLADAVCHESELARRYAETIVTEPDPDSPATQELIRDYVLKNSHRPEKERPSVRGLVPHFSRTGRG